MSKGRLVRLCLMASFFFLASQGFAGPQVFLHPVELLGYEGQDLRLKVLLPCGGEFYGIIAHEGSNRSLELAAAVRQKPIICTGVPEPMSVKVGFLDVHRFDSIGAMITGAPKRIDVRPLESLSLGSLDESGATFVASSKGTCGASLGVLLKPSQEGVLYVGLAGLVRRSGSAVKGDDRQCATQIRESKIQVVSPTAVRRVRPLEINRLHVARQYELRIAPVDVRSLRNGAEGVSVRYFRDCHEAPVGLISKRQAGKKLQVGVLVAHYFNAPCPGGSQGAWAELDAPQLALSQGEQLQSVPVLKDEESLSLRSLSAMDVQGRLPSDGTNAVSLNYYSGCTDQGVYTISAKTRAGHAALGIVTRASRGSSTDPETTANRCSAGARQKRLSYVTSDVDQVYALQLPR